MIILYKILKSNFLKTRKIVRLINKGRTEDALALIADEGRD